MGFFNWLRGDTCRKCVKTCKSDGPPSQCPLYEPIEPEWAPKTLSEREDEERIRSRRGFLKGAAGVGAVAAGAVVAKALTGEAKPTIEGLDLKEEFERDDEAARKKLEEVRTEINARDASYVNASSSCLAYGATSVLIPFGARPVFVDPTDPNGLVMLDPTVPIRGAFTPRMNVTRIRDLGDE